MTATTEKPLSQMDCATVAGTAGLSKRYLTGGSEMGLKQKILKGAKTQIKLTRERAEIWNKHNYKEAERLGLIQYVPIDDVFTILDEATKQIQEKARVPIEGTFNYLYSDEVDTERLIGAGIVKLKEVLAVLEGAEQK